MQLFWYDQFRSKNTLVRRTAMLELPSYDEVSAEASCLIAYKKTIINNAGESLGIYYCSGTLRQTAPFFYKINVDLSFEICFKAYSKMINSSMEITTILNK